MSEPEPAFYIFAPQHRQLHGPDERQTNLAAMRVAAQHQRNRAAGGVGEQRIDIVGRVAQQHDRLIRNIPN